MLILVLGIVHPYKEAQTALKTNLEPFTQASKQPLTEAQAKQVQEIWRVIVGREIVEWDGETWLGLSQEQKEESATQICTAWMLAGYQRIPLPDFLVKSIDEHYQHFIETGDTQGLKAKVGLTMSIGAFFAGMEKKLE